VLQGLDFGKPIKTSPKKLKGGFPIRLRQAQIVQQCYRDKDLLAPNQQQLLCNWQKLLL
jgi:hypothetical protein